jgi:hypothetical protein
MEPSLTWYYWYFMHGHQNPKEMAKDLESRSPTGGRIARSTTRCRITRWRLGELSSCKKHPTSRCFWLRGFTARQTKVTFLANSSAL